MTSPSPLTSRPIGEEDLLAWVDDALDAGRRAEVDAYLAQNPAQAARVAMDHAQVQALRVALAPVAQEPVPVTLSLTALAFRHRARRRHLQSVAQAAAAAVLLSLGGAGGWWLRGAPVSPLSPLPGAIALGREAAASYGVYAENAALPVEITPDGAAGGRDGIGRWASRRLHHPVTVPDLEPAGYRLLGGRMVATPNGPAGMFVYEDGQGNRLVVMSRPMRVRGDARMTPVRPLPPAEGPMAEDTASVPAVAGYAWADDGMGYSLVGLGEGRALHPLADDARRQIRAALDR